MVNKLINKSLFLTKILSHFIATALRPPFNKIHTSLKAHLLGDRPEKRSFSPAQPVGTTCQAPGFKKIKRYLRFFLFLTLITTPLFAAQPSISLELAKIHYIKKNGQIEPTAFLGEPFSLKTIISSTEDIPDKIEIEGIENFSYEEVSSQIQEQSSQSYGTQNRYTIFKEKTLGYRLLPLKEGVFKIGPASFVHDGKTFESNTVTIYVSKKTEEIHDSQINKKIKQNNNSGYELFCKLKASKSTAFIEEPILITLSIYQRGNVLNIRGLQLPQFSNCTIKSVKEIDEFEEEIEDKIYSVKEKKFFVFPTKPGILRILPIRVIYNVNRKSGRRNSFGFMDDNLFSNFFNIGTEQKTTASNSLEIKIKDLPATTKNYNGIGAFSEFKASVDKTETYVNEPIKFTLSLSGVANFDLILTPELNLPKNFKSYESKVETFDQTKTFEYILQIPKSGKWTIPKQTFNYFDTDKKLYKTLQTKPIEIEITMPEGAQTTTPIIFDEKGAQQAEQEILQDINFIEEDFHEKPKKPFYFNFFIFVLIVILIPALFYLKIINTFLKKRFFVPLTAKFFVSKKNILIKYQKNINKIIENNDPGKLYRLFINFFSEIYGVSTAKVNENWIEQTLLKDGFEKEKINLFINFLNECASYSFSSTKVGDIDFKNFEKKANYWLLFIYQSHGRNQR